MKTSFRCAAPLVLVVLVLLGACRETTAPDSPMYARGPNTLVVDTIPITKCGTVITKPGFYKAMTFLYCPHQPGIEVRANNVTLTTSGYGIEGNSEGPCFTAGVGVPGGISHLRILSIDTRTCGTGLLLENVHDSHIQFGTVWFNAVGVRITGVRDLSRNVTLANNDIEDNWYGSVIVEHSTGIVLLHNKITSASGGSPEPALLLSDASHTVIRRNSILGNNYGIVIDAGSIRNLIVGNTVLGGEGAARDMIDRNRCGLNVWRENTFNSANREGCIQ